jgi:integrase
VQQLRTSADDDLARLAFEFPIPTAARASEVLKMRKAEVDLEQRLWTVPAARMKANREHRVPLSSRCLEIVRRASELGVGATTCFRPHRKGADAQHGVHHNASPDEDRGRRPRLSLLFPRPAAETTSFPRELAEMALAHTIENKVVVET